MQERFDVAIIGLGAAGSAAFYHASLSGKRVVGLDRYTPPHSFGSSHGETRIIRRSTYQPSIYVPLADKAYELWQKLAFDAGVDLLRITGGLMLGAEDSGVISRCIECNRDWNVSGDLYTASEVRKRFGQFNIPDNHIAFFENEAGYLLLDQCLQAHLQMGAKNGGVCRLNEPVINITSNSEDEAVQIETYSRRILTDKVVVATGAWMPELVNETRKHLNAERQVLHWMQPRCGEDNFCSPKFPVYIWEVSQDTFLYGFPKYREGRTGIKLAWETFGDYCDPDKISREVTEQEKLRAFEGVKKFIPELAGQIIYSSTCMYPVTEDSDFIIGAHPDNQRIVVIGALQGVGFKFASAIGQLAAQLVNGQQTDIDISKLSLARFSKV